MSKLTGYTGLERDEKPSPHFEDCSPSGHLLSWYSLYARQCRLLRRRVQGGNAQLWQYCGRRLLPQYARQASRESHVGLCGPFCIRQCDVRHFLSRSKYVFPMLNLRIILTIIYDV